MPAIQQAITKYFGKNPSKRVNPDEAVALGAAIQAGIFSSAIKDVLLIDVTPFSLSAETLGGVASTIIDADTPSQPAIAKSSLPRVINRLKW